GLYRGVQDNHRTFRSGLARLDYAATARNTLGFTLMRADSLRDDPADSSVFGSDPVTTVGAHDLLLAATWRWSLTGRMTNEMRAGGSFSSADFRNSLRSLFPFV